MIEEKKIVMTNEDKIKDIAGRIEETLSCCNVLYSAISNENDLPQDIDVSNTIYILSQQLEIIKNDMDEYINFCEQTGLFGNMTVLED